MIIASRGSIWRLLAWQWKHTLFFAGMAILTVVLHELAELTWLTLPATPLAVAGGALGIFVSFRTNSAYDRWWEGRKLWGRMINTSRHISTQAITYVGDKAVAEAMVRRHIAYVHSLRSLLRGKKPRPASRQGAPNHPLEDPEVLRYLTEAEKVQMAKESNITHALLHAQLEQAYALFKAGEIDGLQLQSIDESIRHLLDIQGGCERINKTPMPRGYGFIAERLIIAFSILFPAVIVAQLSWFAIPINILVCLAFALINEAGRVLEDPFTEFWNGLPLTAISNTIERNLLHRLGASDVPEPTAPLNDGAVLM
jgi:putative membrane protein